MGVTNGKSLHCAKTICDILDRLQPKKGPIKIRLPLLMIGPHDFRYAIDASKIEEELGWSAQETFETGIEKRLHGI